MTEEIPKNYPHFFNVSLKLILENEKGEILGLKCAEKNLISPYDLPGGRINSDELRIPYEEILAREIKEEVGDDVKYEIDPCPVSISKSIYFSKTLNRENCIFMVFFKAKYLGGEIRISDEHIGYKWLDLDAEPASKYFTHGFLDGMERYLKR
jgi:8-oxo-dGTP pyrophosphatase MutT (NUDIX family)